MFNIDITQIAIFWSIVGLGIICSINARGFLRQLISWLIVFAIALAAALFSYAGVQSVKQEIGLSETKTQLSSSSAEHLAENEKQLLESVITISDSVAFFPKWQEIFSLGIEKRENFESKALSLRNKSANIYRQIRALIPQNPQSERQPFYDSLLIAAENLRLAGYEVHYQFGLERDSLGKSINSAREHAAQAKSIAFSIIGKE
jgi:hypothetical protein